MEALLGTEAGGLLEGPVAADGPDTLCPPVFPLYNNEPFAIMLLGW